MDWSRNMAKGKTTGKVIQRSDQWVEAGVITIFVSGLLTISWRVYTVGKIPFWSAWPGILGVAVVAAGLMMVAIGIALGQKEDGLRPADSNGGSNSSDQRQTAATRDSAQRSHDP
jgi:hypothetical protein